MRFLPRRGLVTVVPYNNREVVFQRLDLAAAIQESGDDLFVMSTPNDLARRGTKYVYALQAQSRRGGVLMTLEESPPGATLGADGVLRWNVPEAGPSLQHRVVIQLTDRSSAARSHQFDLLVLGEEDEPETRSEEDVE